MVRPRPLCFVTQLHFCSYTGVEVPGGLLYYTQSEEIMRVPSPRNELRGLIMARNELASYMMRKRSSKLEGECSTSPNHRQFLPSTLDDDYKCSKCYVVDGCMLYRKVLFRAPVLRQSSTN
jgi:DNA replication ATP-dependent helicase/nuclease Dna2